MFLNKQMKFYIDFQCQNITKRYSENRENAYLAMKNLSAYCFIIHHIDYRLLIGSKPGYKTDIPYFQKEHKKLLFSLFIYILMNDKFAITTLPYRVISHLSIPWVWSLDITLGLWPQVISQFPHGWVITYNSSFSPIWIQLISVNFISKKCCDYHCIRQKFKLIRRKYTHLKVSPRYLAKVETSQCAPDCSRSSLPTSVSPV